VNCWNGKVKKIQIVLRKHRDVIFDISLDENALYSVQSESDPFYDAIEKKLVKAGVEVNFFSGTLKHFWVGRNFRGALLLRKNGILIGRYFPGDVSRNAVGEEPKNKPAPLLIAMKSHNGRPPDSYSQVFSQVPTLDELFTLVVQLDIEGPSVPREVLNYFMHGSDKELWSSGNVATRNWVYNQVAAQLGFVGDNLNWMTDLFGNRVKFQKIKGTLSVVLSGNNRARKHLTAVWYGAKNAKVISFSFGVGSAAGLPHAGWGALKGMVGRGSIASICFVIAIDVAEWLLGFEDKDPVTGIPKRDWNDLFIKVGTDITKVAIGGLLTAAAGYIFGSIVIMGAAMIGATVAVPAIVICIGLVILNFAVGFLVDWSDQKSQVSDRIQRAIKPSIEKLEKNFGPDYRGFDGAIGQALALGSLGA